MSARLSADSRKAIVEGLIEAAMKDRAAVLLTREHALAKQVYLHVLDGHGAAVQSVLDGFYITIDRIDIRLYDTEKAEKLGRGYAIFQRAVFTQGWKETYKHPKVQAGPIRIGETVRMPHKVQQQYATLIKTSMLGSEIDQLRRDYATLVEDLKVLYDTVCTAVNSVSTVKRLLELCPELAPLYPGPSEEHRPGGTAWADRRAAGVHEGRHLR